MEETLLVCWDTLNCSPAPPDDPPPGPRFVISASYLACFSFVIRSLRLSFWIFSAASILGPKIIKHSHSTSIPKTTQANRAFQRTNTVVHTSKLTCRVPYINWPFTLRHLTRKVLANWGVMNLWEACKAIISTTHYKVTINRSTDKLMGVPYMKQPQPFGIGSARW